MAGDRNESREQEERSSAGPMDTDEPEDVKPNIQEQEAKTESDDEERTEPAGSQNGHAPEQDNPTSFQDELDGLSPEELFARVDQDKLGQLQLLKRYHADARAFIRLLENGYKEHDDETPGAIAKIVQLLESKAKSEVLEAIDFLAVAFQYKIEAAEVSLLRERPVIVVH